MSDVIAIVLSLGICTLIGVSVVVAIVAMVIHGAQRDAKKYREEIIAEATALVEKIECMEEAEWCGDVHSR